MVNLNRVKQGKKNRASGAAFELRVRRDLTEKGWIVDKWSNNVELDSEHKPEDEKINKLVPAKRKYFGPGRPMAIGTGFPDFISFRRGYCEVCNYRGLKSAENYEVIGVECKINGYLDKIEKEKCRWLLKKNIFSKIYIASKNKIKNRIIIEYNEFGK